MSSHDLLASGWQFPALPPCPRPSDNGPLTNASTHHTLFNLETLKMLFFLVFSCISSSSLHLLITNDPYSSDRILFPWENTLLDSPNQTHVIPWYKFFNLLKTEAFILIKVNYVFNMKKWKKKNHKTSTAKPKGQRLDLSLKNIY